jgi:CRISPR-associated protein Csd1
LRELAVLGKSENVPPNLAGDWMRAILTGTPYPLTLLSTALMRMRSDGEINALRVAIVKSVLIRNLKVEAPVALDPANTNKGYILGRLFAVYEEVQRAALGGNVNATIKDKFYGSASATPQKVFSALSSGSQNHFSKLKKQSPGRAVNLEKLLMTITDLMEPGADPIPVSLASAEQALFGIGYYHQRSDFFRKLDDSEPNLTESAQ